MKNKNNRALVKVAAAALALVLVAAACGSDDDDSQPSPATAAPSETDAPPGTDATTTSATPMTSVAPATPEAPTTSAEPVSTGTSADLPGEGVSITMARADWATGYFQASLYRQLLQRLGYDVSDPADKELGPSLAYLSMAEGDIDFWVNSWYPGHKSWLETELPDGSQVGDHVSAIGEEMIAGGLQGLLVTKSFAEEYNIRTLDDLNNNPDALAAYDSDDASPGDGVADIYGCQESYTCDDILASQIEFSGWENIRQIIAGYDAMFAEAASRIEDDEPVVLYTWTPSSYITRVRPGDNVMWIGVEEVVDDSNPLGRDGGEEWDQRPGLASLDSSTCLYVVEGGCQLGWVAADILVTARNDLLENNPAVKKLFELVKLNVVDVSLQIVEQTTTDADPDDLAARWIEENSDLVESWLAEAMAAA